MVRINFLPDHQHVELGEGVKLLAAARRAKVDIKFGCAACRCGTCAVYISQNPDHLSPMRSDEKDLLNKMKLPTDGSIRLACQARVLHGEVTVQLKFQEIYSPDRGMDEQAFEELKHEC